MRFVARGCFCAVALAMVGCADGPGSPTSPSATAAVSGLAATTLGNGATGVTSSSASPRSGALHVTKECSEFETKFFCTVTASNLAAIEVGSRILYLQPDLVETEQGSDVILDPPGPGNNQAFGNCALAFGVCTFSGGTGKFTHFQARVAVTANDDFSEWYWNGTYSFSPKD